MAQPLVLEAAENNERALEWHKKRSFKKLERRDFIACPVEIEPDLLPPRELPVGEEAPAPDNNNEEVSGEQTED